MIEPNARSETLKGKCGVIVETLNEGDSRVNMFESVYMSLEQVRLRNPV